MPQNTLPSSKLLATLTLFGCFAFAVVLTGCGDGGPDDPATIKSLKDLGVLVVVTNEQAGGLNNLPSDPAKLTEAIEASSKLKMLKNISAMSGVPITDEHLATIGKNKNLMEISLKGANITDAGVANLAGCKNLKSVTLVDCPITSESLAALSKCPKLNMLNLNGTKVAGGFDSLQACSNLQWILIGGLNISDAEAEAISKIPAISHITYTNETQISDAAIETLKSIKDCTVDMPAGQ